jgi:hypothetical protein
MMSRFPLNHFVYVLIMYKQLHRVGVRKEVSTDDKEYFRVISQPLSYEYENHKKDESPQNKVS